MKKLSLIKQAAVIAFSLFSIVAIAEERVVLTGHITDEDGKPLPGATVVAAGTYSGTATLADGSYKLILGKEDTYTIKVSFIGYHGETREMYLSGNTTADFTLQSSFIPANEVVVQATRAGSKTPVTYKTVSGEELSRASFGTDMPFLLRLTPSLVETSEAGTGVGYTAMRIRGSDASRINVTIDGIPLNDAESQQVFWVNMPDFVSSVESIQVQRGVGTSGNGAAAFGASVNIQTMSPGSEPSVSASTAIGSFRTMTRSISAETGLLNDRFAFMLRYSDIDSEGYIRHSGSDHRSMFLSGVYSYGSSRLKANIILGEERTGISWWGVPADMLDTDRRYNPAGIYTDSQGVERYYTDQTDNYWQNHYHLIYTTSTGNGLFLHAAAHMTEGKGYYEQYRSDNKLEAYGIEPLSIGDTTIARTDLVRRKWNDNIFYGITYSLKYYNGTTEAVVGGAVNRHDGDHFGRIIWMRYAGATDKGYEWYFNNSVKDEFNVYGKITHTLFSRLSLYADMQYRNIDYKMEGVDDNLANLSMRHRYHFINPKAGLFYSPTSQQDVYFSVAVAHREPTRANFKDAVGDDQATPKHERLTDFEAGYVLRRKNITMGANLYYMLYDNQLVPTGELSNVGYPIMTNVKDSYRAGVEITAAVKPADFIEWNMNLTLSRNKIKDFVKYYTNYNTSDWSEEYMSEELGIVDISYSPQVIFGSSLSVRPSNRTELVMTGKYVGSQYFDNTMSSDRRLDAYFVSGITGGYSFSFRGIREGSVQFTVNNLFDNMYISNGYGGLWYEDGTENTWAYYFPQAGRNYMMKVSFSF